MLNLTVRAGRLLRALARSVSIVRRYRYALARSRALNLKLAARLTICSELLSRCAERRPTLPPLYDHDPSLTLGRYAPRPRPIVRSLDPRHSLTDSLDYIAADFDPITSDAIASIGVALTTDDSTDNDMA